MSALVTILTFKEKLRALLERERFSNLLARRRDREHSKVKGMGCLGSPEVWPALQMAQYLLGNVQLWRPGL